MISCREMTDLVTDYLEKRMPLVERIRFRFHIAACRKCKNYLSTMENTVACLGYLPKEEVPADVKAELLEHFKDWKSKQTVE